MVLPREVPSSPPRRGRRRSAQEVHELLLGVSARLIAREGIDAVNSNGLARAAGVGVGTFYNHFADKRVVHRAVVERALEGLQARLAEAARASSEKPLEQQVRAQVLAALEFAQAEPDLFRVACAQPPPAAEPGRARLAPSNRVTERRLAQLQRQGLLDPAIDPALAARGYAAQRDRLLLLLLDTPERVERSALIETLTRLHPALAGRPRR